ncbi:hypothetical protein AgCh_029044 [Apium graveolens]
MRPIRGLPDDKRVTLIPIAHQFYSAKPVRDLKGTNVLECVEDQGAVNTQHIDRGILNGEGWNERDKGIESLETLKHRPNAFKSPRESSFSLSLLLVLQLSLVIIDITRLSTRF